MNIISTNLLKRLIYLSIIPVFAMGDSTIMSADSGAVVSEQLQTRKKLIILPVDNLDGGEEIGFEVGRIVAGVATELGRFEIIDRNDLKIILQEQDLALLGLVNDSDAVRLGQIAAAQEALRISVVSFSQIGVPPNDEEEDDDSTVGKAIFGALIEGLVQLAKKDKSDDTNTIFEKWPNNISTELKVEIRHLDLETGQALNSMLVDGSHTGGDRGKSRSKATAQLRNRVRTQLRQLYLLESTVVSIIDQQVILPFGGNLGVKPGMIFKIGEPDQTSQFGASTIQIPGRTVAYVKAMNVAESGSRSRVLRQWGAIKPGYRVDELLRPIVTTNILLRNSLNGEGIEIGLSSLAQGSSGFYFGLGIGFVSATDSRNDRDSGISIKALSGLRFRLSKHLTFSPDLNLGMQAYFRPDDANKSATGASALVALGASVEYLLSKHIDIVVGSGYDFGGTTGKWILSNTAENESDEAQWNSPRPDIDTGGFYFNLGIRYLFTLPFFPGLR